MRRVAKILAMVLFCSAFLPAAAKESAKSLYKKGTHAEALQDYEAAYEYYKQAYELQPTEVKYRVPFERLRFLAAATKTHRATQLRDQGKLQEALTLYEEAAAIDPSNDLAAQEIRHTQELIQKQAGGGPVSGPPKRSEEDVLRKRLEDARPPVRLQDISNQQLSALEFVTEDTKVIYETIGKLAGINVLFDPDYQSRRLPLKLKNVTLQEALDIVALDSRTFWRPVTPNTIFVAADTPTKRRELEQNVIKTFYLGNVSTPTDLQDIVNAIRTVLEVSRIQQIPSQNAIVIKGTPDQLALAQKMVDDIDKGKPEVVVDVIVAQVRRDKLRDMGITPPQNATIALSNGTVTTTGGSSGSGSSTTPTSNFPNFNDLQHLNSTNYAVTIDPIKIKLLFSDSSSKILQSPRVRATDNEKATIKVGDKIPIATGSFGTPVGVGAVGAGLGVNTQFTYTDVGVKLEITPHIHPDGQITLKTAMEISNVSTSVTIGGITQPVISQRTADQVIRLNDGEINLLGGILEQTETKTAGGTPFLGQIPFLRYFFSDVSHETVTNEIVFLLIPHIVRRQELTELNTRPFDVGTGTSIDLRLGAKPLPPVEVPPVVPVAPQPTPPPAVQNPAPGTPQAQNAPAVPAPTPAPQAQPASLQATAGAASQGAGGQVSLRFDPPGANQAQGSTFSVNVVLAHGQDVAAVSAQIIYDPKLVQFVSATQGDFLTKDGLPAPLANRDDAATGRVTISARRPPSSAGVSGDGTVFNLMFLAKAKGAVTFAIAPVLRNTRDEQVVVAGSQAVVTVN
jgi:general secretion pathway protein D